GYFQTIKDLVSQRYEEEKEKTKKDLQSAVAVTLTMLRVLAPFDQATRELSKEKRVSASKVIHLMRMIHIELQRQATTVTKTAAQQLAENLRKRLTDAICSMESLSVMTLATLLDPRFKTIGFVSQQKANEAVKRLKSECAEEMRSQEPDPTEEETSSSHGSEPSSGYNLWKTLDMEVAETQKTSNATADSIIEVQRYLKTYPHLHQLALKTLCSTSSSVCLARPTEERKETAPPILKTNKTQAVSEITHSFPIHYSLHGGHGLSELRSTLNLKLVFGQRRHLRRT
uniref:HAT C-terminal dimerisation domain-containing protein n=1 Tax=Takifugu rubripes TaxID=31033 RepID=A0A674M8Q3_TAKRU